MSDPMPASERVTSEQIGLRTLRERRWRVYRGALMLVLSTIVVVVLSVLNRDEAAIRACRERMEYARQALQDTRDRNDPVPPRLPLPELAPDDPESHLGREHLRDPAYYNPLFDLRHDSGRGVGVCCCRFPHTRLIGSCGRQVVLYDPVQRKFTLQWMDEDTFQRRADELGLRAALEPQ